MYQVTPERARVLERHPDYSVTLHSASGRYRVTAGDILLADSERVVEVRESFHGPVVYFPADDVDFSHLKPSDHRTRCPFKGDAHYHHLARADGSVVENAVWSYPQPVPEVGWLEGLYAFYSDKVEIERV